MKYEDFIVRHRRWIIIIPVIITLLAAIPLLKTKVNPDLEKYLPTDTPAMLAKAKIDTLFGNSDPVLLIFQAENILNDTSLIRLKKISRAFHQAKEFDGVISLFDTKSIKGEYGAMIVDPVIKRIPKTEKQREKLRQEIRQNELAYGTVISKDFTKTLLILKVAEGVTDEQVVRVIDETLHKFPGTETVYKGGTVFLRVQVNSDISRDMLILMPLGLLIMILFLLFSFREWKSVALPLIVVTMSIVISLGFFPLMGWELSIITILAPIMMIAIANNYGVHFIARYQELNVANPDWSMMKITKQVLYLLKNPVIITGLTTIAGVLGLVTNVLLPAKQLGIAAALGIAFALLLSITFIPAVMAGMKKGKVLKSVTREKPGIIEKSLAFLAKKTTARPVVILFLFGSFLLLAGAGIVRLQVNSNSENFLPSKHPFRQATSIINEDFGGTKFLTVLFEGDIKDPDLLKRMEYYEKELKKDPSVGNVTSLASVIKIMSRAINDPGDEFYDKIPDTREAVAQYLELYSMSGDPEDFDDLVNFDYTKALMIVQFRADTKNALDNVISEIDRLTNNDPDRSLIGGYCLIDKELAEAVVHGQYTSLVFAILIIALLLIVIFRSAVSGLLGSLPLIFTVITLFGTMGWLGIKLDIGTAMLSSIAIGIGVDYTIHYFWRYKYELGLGKSYKEAVTTTLITTGRGITINAFSVILGFVILFVSSFLTIKYFAFLIIFSVLLCLLCALILVPALCLLMKPKFLEKK